MDCLGITLEELFVDSVEPRFVTMFVLQYPVVGNIDQLRKYVEMQLKCDTFSVYSAKTAEAEQGYYFVVRLENRLFVRRGGMFKYEGIFPRIFEIKTDGDFYRIDYQLGKSMVIVDSVTEKKSTVPFSEIDVTSFDFVEGEDEAEFQRRAEILKEYIMNYDEKKSPTFMNLSTRSQPLKKVIPKGRIQVK